MSNKPGKKMKSQHKGTAARPGTLPSGPTPADHSQRPATIGEAAEIARQQIATTLASTGFLDELTGAQMEVMGNLLRAQGTRLRPLKPSEYIVPPQPYNERGDIAVLIGRQYVDPNHAFTMLLTYSADGETYNYVIFQEDHQYLARSRFLTLDLALRAELDRQIELYPRCNGRSAMFTVVTIPGNLQPQYGHPDPEAPSAKDSGEVQETEAAGNQTLDSLFAPEPIR